jgi:hypothetical protein
MENIGIYTAIIIEPRKHPAMEFVLQNFTDNLDTRWNFIIFHGIDNDSWLKDLISNINISNKDRIQLYNLGVKNLTIPEYSKLCVSRSFIELIPTEIFLIFQTDTMICSSEKELIYKFLQYDYVGAPWCKENTNNPGCGKVGNGGLSLRRKTKMLEVISKVPYKINYHEDTYFCVNNTIVPLNMPSWEEAQLFSMETVYSAKCFGLHKAWQFQNISKVEQQFPGFSELVKLNSKI